MKLTIFGASGATGKLLIEQALAAGNEWWLTSATLSKIPSQTGLTVIQGN